MITAKANFEAAKGTFLDVDRHVFEWLYILEEYRGDILDSTLQTLKYLQYEFFATSAQAISLSLPSRMEFRPMVEMTPRHLEAQVEMELRESEDLEDSNKEVADFSARLIEKRVKDDPKEAPQLPVDPLSLSSLLSQGFEEGPARRALRLHQNDTQAALDWLVNGQSEAAEKQVELAEGVRMPTTIKRVQKLNAMRKAQAEKKRQAENKNASTRANSSGKRQSQENDDDSDEDEDGDENEVVDTRPQARPQAQRETVQQTTQAAAPTDLLSLDEEPPKPTDFSNGVVLMDLPQQVSFDTVMSQCEKVALPAAVAAGISQSRPASASGESAPSVPSHLASMVQTLASSSNVSPEQLIQAAQQLQAAQQQSNPTQQAAQQLNPSMKAAPPPLSNLVSGIISADNNVNGAKPSTPSNFAVLQQKPSSPTGWAALQRVPASPPAASSNAANLGQNLSGYFTSPAATAGGVPASGAMTAAINQPKSPSSDPSKKQAPPKSDAFGDLVNFS
jgi:hypothetical protein